MSDTQESIRYDGTINRLYLYSIRYLLEAECSYYYPLHERVRYQGNARDAPGMWG
jgi:hypothetical protein